MDLIEFAKTRLGWVDPRLLALAEKYLKSVPAVQATMEKEYEPNPAKRKIYDELFREFVNVYESNKAMYVRQVESGEMKVKKQARHA